MEEFINQNIENKYLKTIPQIYDDRIWSFRGRLIVYYELLIVMFYKW